MFLFMLGYFSIGMFAAIFVATIDQGDPDTELHAGLCFFVWPLFLIMGITCAFVLGIGSIFVKISEYFY